MYTTVGRLSSYISQGVYTFSGPFHPFGGAVDIIVVQQQDGSFKSTPWYVKFGKFQGVLKRKEKIVTIAVDDVEANFHMYLDHKGEAFFLGEEKNPFSPGSSPEEPLAIEYHKDAARQEAAMVKVHQDSDCKDETSDDEDEDNELTQPNGSHADELRPATALVANTTMMAIEKVAESDSGAILEVYEKTEAAPVSSTALDDSIIDAPIQTEVIEERYLLKTETPTKSSEGDVQIAELESQVRGFGSGSSIEADVSMITEECSTSGISVEQTWSSSSSDDRREALVKDSDLKQQLDNAEKRPWVWFWKGGGTALSKQASDTKVLMKEKISPADFQDTASLTDDEHEGDRKNRNQKPSRSLLGLMFGASGKQAQERANSLPTSPRNVVELLEDKWTTGTNGKLGSSPPSAKWIGRAQSAQNSNSYHLDARDLSGAEVVLMSVDGHVVVARQDEGGPSDSSFAAEDHVSVSLDVDDKTETVACKMRLQSPSKASTFVHQPRLSFHDDTGAVENSASTKKPSVSAEALLAASEAAAMQISLANGMHGYFRRSWQVRTLIPTSSQLASLNLKEGMNKITFTFTTRVLGKQQVDARIYLWKWDAKIVISDVDGTITKSDVLGQVMPLVGRDWTQTGVTRLFSAIEANGYKLMFLSARAISQAYLTRQFLVNLKQDGEPLPDGPVVISPDGLFPSLYREVIRRAPHEFKISCLEDIKALFPAESQPFYAGFGNRDTDEISYLKVGIPKGKIFLINPKGEVIVNNFLDLKSYTSLHKLVNDMFPPVHMAEREDFNSWNFWKMPLPDLDGL